MVVRPVEPTECASGPRPSPGCTVVEAEGPDRVRKGREAAYRFMTAVAGDLPGYEEATRMLFAGDWTAFDAAVEAWPEGVKEHVRMLADRTWRNGAED